MYRAEDTPYSVHELCEALGVARGTFYNHIFRRADRSEREKEQADLMMKVQQIFDESQQRFGAEKIRTILAQTGVHISAKRISAIMQELDLRSIRTNAKKQYKKRQQYQKQNLLAREFTADHPNQIWVSDITYFKVSGYWVYLCIILDLFSRKIVGYRVSRNASTNLVTTTFRNAHQERGRPKKLTFHSDRGKQYTSGAFTQLLQANGVKQSFSATGRPHDNAVAETFFSTFKKEEAYRREYTSEQSFRKSVEQYIQFYNEVRPHQTLKYQTPQAFEDKHYAKFIENLCSNNVMEQK
jgi:transposase InsO family protein